MQGRSESIRLVKAKSLAATTSSTLAAAGAFNAHTLLYAEVMCIRVDESYQLSFECCVLLGPAPLDELKGLRIVCKAHGTAGDEVLRGDPCNPRLPMRTKTHPATVAFCGSLLQAVE